MKEEIIKRRYESLLQMVLDINGIGERIQSKTGLRPTGIFEFHGHCGIAVVRIYKKGWFPYATADIDIIIDCTVEKEYRNACQTLLRVMEDSKCME